MILLLLKNIPEDQKYHFALELLFQTDLSRDEIEGRLFHLPPYCVDYANVVFSPNTSLFLFVFPTQTGPFSGTLHPPLPHSQATLP
jgi:hypothetical protein